MAERTLGYELCKGLLENKYLQKLYAKVQRIYGRMNLGIELPGTIGEKEIDDILVFVDLLSKSSDPEYCERHAALAQELISYLLFIFPEREDIKYAAGNALSAMGNYKGVEIGCTGYASSDLMEQIFDLSAKGYLKVPYEEDKYFFYPQKNIFEKMDSPSLSYSGPTSLGKSFVFLTHLRNSIRKGFCGNFAIVVPSKALIASYVSDVQEMLSRELMDGSYHVVSTALAVDDEKSNYVFVMTPERLLLLINSKKSIHLDYLFIDEAHKISELDQRSTYYYEVSELLASTDRLTHVAFASPNVPNPEVFLSLVGDDGESYATSYSPTSHIKFLISFSEQKASIYNEMTQKVSALGTMKDLSLNGLIRKYSQGKKSLVYGDTPQTSMELAWDYAQTLPVLDDDILRETADEIQEDTHRLYRLADMIRRGVAYHTGQIPYSIRGKIERAFKESPNMSVVFCTSTLIEGVNMPADNLFVYSIHYGGVRNATDFRNLIGRVGRIQHSISGNVFLLCGNNQTSIETFKKYLKAQPPKMSLFGANSLEPSKKRAIIDSLKRGSMILPKEIYAGDPDQRDLLRKIMIILLKDILGNRNSHVRRAFSDLLTDEDLESIKKSYDSEERAPDENIGLTVDQTSALWNAIRNDAWLPSISKGSVSYPDLHRFLLMLLRIFRWDVYESEDLGYFNTEKDAYTKLSRYTKLLQNWISGASFKEMIAKDISSRTTILIKRRLEIFSAKNPDHINQVVADVFHDVEGIILFKLLNYISKYASVYEKVYPDKHCYWNEYVEYGSCIPVVIWLQRIGFSRNTALYIYEHRSDYLESLDYGSCIYRKLLNDKRTDIVREARAVMVSFSKVFI